MAKRVHWSWIATVKARARALGVTPARFELLYALRELHGKGYQAELTSALGLSKSTVSKLLKALRHCGYVDHCWDPGDGRKRIVFFTLLGRRVVERACEELLARRWTQNLYFDAFRRHEYSYNETELDVLDREYGHFADLRCLAHAFGNTSTLQFQWPAFHPAQEDEVYDDPDDDGQDHDDATAIVTWPPRPWGTGSDSDSESGSGSGSGSGSESGSPTPAQAPSTASTARDEKGG